MTALSPYHPEVEALWQAVAQTDARSVAVVSSHAGEGTTLIASALARRAGLAGKPALLVDLNLARPGLARLFGVRPVADDIIDVPALGVAVLAAISQESAARWREPGKLAGQLAEWSANFGLIVLDTAPVLSTDYDTLPATAAAAAADATVLTVLSGRTALSAIRASREKLDAAGARLIGSVMNDRDNPSLLTELERETYRLAPLWPRAMAALRNRLHRATLLAVRV